VNNQWRSDQTISDLPARASAFHVRLDVHSVVSRRHLASVLYRS
jgi:hypothetical protein